MRLLLTLLLSLGYLLNFDDDKLVEEIFKFLEEGDKNIDFKGKTDFIVVLGLTGSGKSTLTHYMSGNPDTLFGVELFGQYLYEDVEGKIGGSGIISHTLFPETTIDPDSGDAVVDCPGFEDTRNASVEIAASYFIKKVYDTSTSVKNILTISNPGVRPGMDRQMLDKLLSNVIQLVVDIDKYADSFAMVVTKVPVNNNNDEREIDNIKSFLNTVVLEDYKVRLQASTDPELQKELSKKINILTVLLNENTNRMAVFREPYQLGPISQSEYNLANKKNIKDVVFDTAHYVKTDTADFDFPLSVESEVFIRDKIYPEIDKKVTELLRMISSQMIGHILYLGENSKLFLELKTQIDHIYHLIWDIDFEDVSRETLQAFVNNCIEYLKSVTYFPLNSNIFNNLFNQFDFFYSFTDKVEDPYGQWIISFTGLRDLTRYLYNWYVTLLSMYDVTGQPEVQKVKNKQFDPDFLDMNYTVYRAGVKDFLTKVKLSQLTEHPDQLNELIQDTGLLFNDFILRDIDIILNLIRPNITCSDDLFIVRSNFVSLYSDILSHINGECKNVSALNIMAYEKILLDGNIELNDMDISITAMDWDVVSSTKLDISGSNGVQREPPRASVSNANTIFDGKFGLPGNPGGYFLALADKVRNINLLKIISNGGRGGKGQDGGNGLETDNNPSVIRQTEVYNTKGALARSCTDRNYRCPEVPDGTVFLYRFQDIWREYQQKPGSGGKGGFGGYSGNIKFTILNNEPVYEISLENGTLGDYGKGGLGWQLGGVETRCRLLPHPAVILYLRYECNVQGRTGKTSLMGKDDVGILDMIEPKYRNLPEFLTINHIIELKFRYLEMSFIHDVVYPIIKLTNHSDILEFYNIKAFLTEIIMIECKMYDIQSDLLYIYLDTMIPVTQSWQTSNYDDQQVMVFLTATLSSMAWTVQMGNATVFVTDLYSYIKKALQTIEDLNTLNMIVATENIKNNYAKSIEMNIMEAQNFINKFIDEVFEDIFSDIQASMVRLVEEINDLKEQIEQNIAELKEKERQLRKNMIAHSIFGVINVAAEVLKLTGPAGTAAGIALGAASSITESLIVGGVVIDQMNPVTLPNGIYNLLKDLEKFKKSMRIGHMETIVFNCEIYSTIPGISEDNKEEANEIKNRALTIPTISNLQEIDKIVEECITDLENLYNAVQPGGNNDVKRKVSNGLSILNYAKKTSQIAAPLLDAMKNYKEDQEKLEIVLDMIEHEQQSLEYLSEFQEAIYHIILPMIETLHNELTTLESELRDHSSVSLIVKRWEITMYINQMTYLIARYTEGFQVEEELVRYFEQLNEAANLVVTLFEQIQYYQEHILFAGYIADLQSVGGGVIPDNTQYRSDLVTLKRAIISSNVRVQCQTIITAFTQQVFPFAHLHLGSLNVPNNNFCEGDDQTVINTITTVDKELDLIRNTIMSNKDPYVFTGIFDSSFVSTPPFCMWDNNSFGNEINQLLKGDEISIMSPIIGLKNAVKFNKIQIRFNRTDGGPQQELQDALKFFTLEQTHFGNSLYQCDDIEFIIRSEPLKLIYSLENDNNGNPVFFNNVYSKLVHGDISLSPYTMWRLKMRVTYSKGGNFNMLIPFLKSNVKMELYGTGQFVEKNANVCKTRLEEYYDFHLPMI